MKFENLKSPLPHVPQIKAKYWNKTRCHQLCALFYLVDDDSLRKYFGGRSISTINKKASELRKAGWDFVQNL